MSDKRYILIFTRVWSRYSLSCPFWFAVCLTSLSETRLSVSGVIPQTSIVHAEKVMDCSVLALREKVVVHHRGLERRKKRLRIPIHCGSTSRSFVDDRTRKREVTEQTSGGSIEGRDVDSRGPDLTCRGIRQRQTCERPEHTLHEGQVAVGEGAVRLHRPGKNRPGSERHSRASQGQRTSCGGNPRGPRRSNKSRNGWATHAYSVKNMEDLWVTHLADALEPQIRANELRMDMVFQRE